MTSSFLKINRIIGSTFFFFYYLYLQNKFLFLTVFNWLVFNSNIKSIKLDSHDSVLAALSEKDYKLLSESLQKEFLNLSKKKKSQFILPQILCNEIPEWYLNYLLETKKIIVEIDATIPYQQFDLGADLSLLEKFYTLLSSTFPYYLLFLFSNVLNLIIFWFLYKSFSEIVKYFFTKKFLDLKTYYNNISMFWVFCTFFLNFFIKSVIVYTQFIDIYPDEWLFSITTILFLIYLDFIRGTIIGGDEKVLNVPKSSLFFFFDGQHPAVISSFFITILIITFISDYLDLLMTIN